MRLSEEHIKALQVLLKELTGRAYTSEEAQLAGLAIIRTIIAKNRRHKPTNNKEQLSNNEQLD